MPPIHTDWATKGQLGCVVAHAGTDVGLAAGRGLTSSPAGSQTPAGGRLMTTVVQVVSVNHSGEIHGAVQNWPCDPSKLKVLWEGPGKFLHHRSFPTSHQAEICAESADRPCILGLKLAAPAAHEAWAKEAAACCRARTEMLQLLRHAGGLTTTQPSRRGWRLEAAACPTFHHQAVGAAWVLGTQLWTHTAIATHRELQCAVCSAHRAEKALKARIPAWAGGQKWLRLVFFLFWVARRHRSGTTGVNACA